MVGSKSGQRRTKEWVTGSGARERKKGKEQAGLFEQIGKETRMTLYTCTQLVYMGEEVR